MSDLDLTLTASDGCLHLVQITDTHLKDTEGGTLLGLDTDFSLGHVLRLVAEKQEKIDLLLGTGDISDHGSDAAYRRAGQYFAGLAKRVMWLVGNHDCAKTMATVLGEAGELVRVARSDAWQVLMLDSQIPGEVGGELGTAELAWLEARLAEGDTQGLHSLVCLHHQPLPVGSAWIDEQMIADSEAFFAVIDRFPGVRGVLWGHVHQVVETERNGLPLMSTPSSCIQFAPGSDNFKVDDLPPGYRWLKLHADGTIETGVERVQGVRFEVDLESSGYL